MIGQPMKNGMTYLCVISREIVKMENLIKYNNMECSVLFNTRAITEFLYLFEAN